MQHLERITMDEDCREGWVLSTQATATACHLTRPPGGRRCNGGVGDCGLDWYPSSVDTCRCVRQTRAGVRTRSPPQYPRLAPTAELWPAHSASCGRVYEPFWDECGAMLSDAHMGGMGGGPWMAWGSGGDIILHP